MELAFSYARFSSPEQAAGDSLRRQDSLREGWLARHPEVRLDTSFDFVDRGVSALRGRHRTDPKNAMARFSDLVTRGRIPRGSWLLVESVDRLSREDPEESLPFILSLTRAGVRIVVLWPTETVFESGMGMPRMLALLMELFRSNSESVHKSGRVSKAWATKRKAARESGTPMSANLPRWLALKDGKIVPVPDRVAVVRRVFELVTAGYGLVAVGARLRADGLAGWGRRGTFTRGFLGRLVRERRVLGEHRGANGTVIKNYFPAVVSEGEWAAANRAMRARHHRPARVKGRHINVFAGLLRNPVDGSVYLLKDGRLVNFKHTEGAAPPSSFPFASLEGAVFDRLRELDPAEVTGEPAPDRVGALSAEVTRLEADIAAIERELEAGGEIPSGMRLLRRKEDRLAAVRDELNAERARAAHPAAETMGEVRTLAAVVAEARDPDDVRVRIQAALRRVVVRALMHVVVRGSARVACVQFDFLGGGRRMWFVEHVHGHRPSGVLRRKPSWRCLDGLFGPSDHKLDLADPRDRELFDRAFGLREGERVSTVELRALRRDPMWPSNAGGAGDRPDAGDGPGKRTKAARKPATRKSSGR